MELWASQHKLPIFPTTATHVALYLPHLRQTKDSKAAIEEAVNGLTWAHSVTGLTVTENITKPIKHIVASQILAKELSGRASSVMLFSISAVNSAFLAVDLVSTLLRPSNTTLTKGSDVQ